MTTSSGTFNILLIDNDDDDRILFATALKESGLKAELFEAKDGYAGLNYIFGDGQYSDRHKFPVPNIVFLDVKMLGIDGFAVLGRIRSVPKTKSLPVIMLSNSDLASDVQAAYLSGANAFHRKPGTYRALVDLLRTILTPWKDVNFRPPHYKSGETQWKQIMHKIR